MQLLHKHDNVQQYVNATKEESEYADSIDEQEVRSEDTVD